MSPLLRLVRRGDTRGGGAYFSPILHRYVDEAASELDGEGLYSMRSNGGLVEDAILSGPTVGLVDAARTARIAGLTDVIGFDMAGTSTDVALYDRPRRAWVRYPVRLEQFLICRSTCVAGEHYGGDQAVRRIRVLEPTTAVIIASRRNVGRFCLECGADGPTGRQWVKRADRAVEPLRRADSAELAPEDPVVIGTPGGGGFGSPVRSRSCPVTTRYGAAITNCRVEDGSVRQRAFKCCNLLGPGLLTKDRDF